jgi:hypothetical protein
MEAVEVVVVQWREVVATQDGGDNVAVVVAMVNKWSNECGGE